MDFRTIYKIKSFDFDINHNHKIVFIGSCFSENIALKLKNAKFQTLTNPFGIVYNPISISKNLERIVEKKYFAPNELDFFNNKYFSFQHHSSFSSENIDICLNNINKEFEKSINFLPKADFLIITLGTSHIYKYLKNNTIVSNCHKIPQKHFSKELLKLNEIVEEYKNLFDKLFKTNKELKVIFTISPIRYLSDGFEQNFLSKSILRCTIDELINSYQNIYYFPSYEIQNDDLRDYRFYKSDMLHPTQQAIDYIWNIFSETYFSNNTKKIINLIEDIQKAMLHTPFDKYSENYLKFKTKYSTLIDKLIIDNGNINFDIEKDFFNK